MPANTRQLSMGVLNETERARIVDHLTEHYGDVSKGLRALVGADLIVHGKPGLPQLPHGLGRQKPQLWVWPTGDKRKPTAAIFCRYADHPLLTAGEWDSLVEAVTEEDDPELYGIVSAQPDTLLFLRRGKNLQWEVTG